MKRTLSLLLFLAILFGLAGYPALAETQTYTPGTYTGTAVGQMGPVSVEVALGENKIESIVVTQSAETGGIGDVAADNIIADVLANQSLKLDTVSGCTLSGHGFRMAIEDALTNAGADIAALRNVPVPAAEAKEETMEVDVCVIGSGAAGLMAALEAAQAGAKVVILEKLARTGGATRTSSAMIVAGGSKLQAEAGIEDSVENLKQYWRDRGGNDIDTEMTDYVAEHVNDSLDLLVGLGVNYNSALILQSGTATINRAHMPAQSGVEFCDRLIEKLTSLGVEILLETKAESLVQNESGEVVGVKAKNENTTLTVNADAVVIATGGYSWNSEMVDMFAPAASGAWPVSAPGNTGDGLKMAMDIGADTVFKGGFIGWKVVSPAYGHTSAIGAPIYGAANLIVNQKGDRFSNEAEDYPFLYNAMEADGSDKFYFIFQSASAETKDLVNNVSNTVANLELGVAAGVCFKGETLEELAAASGLTNLPDAVAQFNSAIEKGTDEAFQRDTATMISITEGPFYALQSQRATLGTFGGLNTNITGEVVDSDEKPIPGLYAAGEVANGEFFPVIYPASGSALSMCVVLGREAGRSAAAYAAK